MTTRTKTDVLFLPALLLSLHQTEARIIKKSIVSIKKKISAIKNLKIVKWFGSRCND